MSRPLWHYVIAESRGSFLLTEDDFEGLALAVQTPMPAPIPSLDWTPWPALHQNYVYCLAEISGRLAPTAAEQFATLSVAFGKQLEQPNLTLSGGTLLVGEWVREIRRILSAMGEQDLLPTGDGGLAATPASSGEGIPAEMRPYIASIRKAFAANEQLRFKSTNDVQSEVSGNRQAILRALQLLKERHEYIGTTRSPASILNTTPEHDNGPLPPDRRN